VDGEVGEIPGLSGGVPKASVRTTVTIDDLHSAWIPAPYPAVRITGLEGRWDVGTRDLTIGADGSATEGQRYTVQSSRIVPTSSELAHASTLYPAEVRPELALPGPIPKNILAAAQKATRGAKTDYQKAVDLEAYFRDGDFSYSLQTPLKQGYEGDGLAVISKFLQVKSGYCVHFASAMAIMARVLGIPARVAIGYLPGIGTPELSGRTVYTVTSDQLHSWPELYFSGIGWVRFEPTVSLGTIPSYAVAPAGPDTATADPLAPQSTQPTPTSALPPQTANGTTDVAETAPLASGRLNIAALSVIALLVLLLPAVAGMLRRVLHRARLAWGAAPAGSAWQAVSEYAVDLRRVRARQGRTIRRLAAELRLDGARAALLRLRDQAERERYGPDASGSARRELSADLGEVTRALRRDAGPRRRLAALLAPVSLVPASGRPRRGGPEVSASPGHMTSHSRTILGREHRPTVPVPPRRP
jgi:transglutaminase-like putative cysteine protease